MNHFFVLEYKKRFRAFWQNELWDWLAGFPMGIIAFASLRPVAPDGSFCPRVDLFVLEDKKIIPMDTKMAILLGPQIDAFWTLQKCSNPLFSLCFRSKADPEGCRFGSGNGSKIYPPDKGRQGLREDKKSDGQHPYKRTLRPDVRFGCFGRRSWA